MMFTGAFRSKYVESMKEFKTESYRNTLYEEDVKFEKGELDSISNI